MIGTCHLMALSLANDLKVLATRQMEVNGRRIDAAFRTFNTAVEAQLTGTEFMTQLISLTKKVG